MGPNDKSRRTIVCLSLITAVLIPFFVILAQLKDSYTGGKMFVLSVSEGTDALAPSVRTEQLPNKGLDGHHHQHNEPAHGFDWLNGTSVNVSEAIRIAVQKDSTVKWLDATLVPFLTKQRTQQVDFCLKTPKDVREKLTSGHYLKARAFNNVSGDWAL